MSEKKLHSLAATHEVTDLTGVRRRTGRVAVKAIPGWLKTEEFVAASITPQRARLLAIQLLTAAEEAERGSSW